MDGMRCVAGRDNTNWDILAGLRFVLAAIVACGHVSYYFADADPVTRWLGDLGGKVAVVGFLLISGYSIAASLSTRRDGFYRRRLLRIYPMYGVAILFAGALEFALDGVARMPSGEAVIGTGPWVTLGNLLFGQTFFVKPMAFDGPVWSLAVEVSYYVASPLLLRLDRRVLLGLLAVSALAYVAPRRDDWGGAYYAFSRLNALIYAWAWLMGFVLHGTRRGWLPAAFAAGGAVLIVLKPFNNPEAAAPVTFVATFGSVLAAATLARGWRLPGWLRTGLAYLGDLSYPLYLVHFPALIAAVGLGLTHAAAATAFAVALSVAALATIDVRLKRLVLAALPGLGMRPVSRQEGSAQTG